MLKLAGRALPLVVPLLVTLTACGSSTPQPAAAPPAPAVSAGGACHLLDFAVVKAKLGLDLGEAAAAGQENSSVCVMQPHNQSLPDLTLAVTASPISADIFTATIQPNGATPVPGLGSVAYRLTSPAAAASGPVVEVGWLAGNQRIITLTVRLPPDAPLPAPLLDAMISLAKLIDLSSL